MNTIDQDIDTIAKILMENTTYSPQVRAYIIHGAIQKLIEWRDSFLGAEGTKLQERKKCYIVINAHAVWKRMWFETAEQAAGVVKAYYRDSFFRSSGGGVTTLVDDVTQAKYTIMQIDQYLSMADIKQAQ
jgi:hypothetical protein